MKMNADHQFEVSRESLSAILEQYNRQLVSYAEATSGIENSTTIAQTNYGPVVVRVYRQARKAHSTIVLEIEFMNYLRHNGLKIPGVFPNQAGHLVTTFTDGGATWQCIVMEFVDGGHAKTYSPQLISELATAQAQMHLLSGQFKIPATVQRTIFDLHESHFIKLINRSTVPDGLRDFLQRGEEYAEVLDPTLPAGLCHMDYDLDNTIAKGNSLEAILDFDDLTIAPFVMCLSYTLWHVLNDGGDASYEHYLGSYEAVRPLTELERSFIAPIMLFRHYVISSARILNHHTSATEIAAYLEFESRFLATVNRRAS